MSLQAPTPQQFAVQSLLELRDETLKVLPDYLALQDKLNRAVDQAFKDLGVAPVATSRKI